MLSHELGKKISKKAFLFAHPEIPKKFKVVKKYITHIK